MFPRSYFPRSYFSPSYWPMGFSITIIVAPSGIGLFNEPLFFESFVGLF